MIGCINGGIILLNGRKYYCVRIWYEFKRPAWHGISVNLKGNSTENITVYSIIAETEYWPVSYFFRNKP